MPTSKVAKRYAQGLLDFAQESGQTASVFSEMKDVERVMDDSKDLVRFLQTPFIDSKKKEAATSEIFRNFSPVVQNLIRLVIRHGRESQLKNIAQEFINKVEDMEGVQRITLTSASQLSQQNIDDILRSANLVDTQRKYDLQTIINPEILGGYILRVGDQQVDSSVRTKLANLKKEFQLN